MKRANLAAGVAALLVPAALLAQEGTPKAPAALDGPAVTEPDPGSIPQPGTAPTTVIAPVQGANGETPEVYVVQPGDTLWDLSQKYLGNPWYWPKVWSYNPEIENPHWIYPGHELRFFSSAEELPARVDEGQGESQPQSKTSAELGEVTVGTFDGPTLTDKDGEDPVSMSDSRARLAASVARHPMMRQEGMVTQRELDESGVIDSSWAERDMLSTYDKVYLKFRNPGSVRVGELYSVFRPGGDVRHPITGKRYGVLTRMVGTLRITATGSKLVTGVIEQCNDSISRGDLVGPLGAFVKPIAARPNGRNLSGYVLASVVPTVPVIGEHHVVFIDKGSADGVEEGNTFNVVRSGDPLYGGDKTAMPEETVATILVVDVKERASTGLVVRSVRELQVGDKVVMVANPPRADAR